MVGSVRSYSIGRKKSCAAEGCGTSGIVCTGPGVMSIARAVCRARAQPLSWWPPARTPRVPYDSVYTEYTMYTEYNASNSSAKTSTVTPVSIVDARHGSRAGQKKEENRLVSAFLWVI